MALIGAPYYFEGGAPTVDGLRERAEQLGGLPIKVTSYNSSADEFEFECLPGKVSVSRAADRIFLSSFAGDAPVLMDLLIIVLEDQGGRMRTEQERVELDLPLTEAGVASATVEYQKELKRLARRAALMFAGIIVAGLSLVGFGGWLLIRWLSG